MTRIPRSAAPAGRRPGPSGSNGQPATTNGHPPSPNGYAPHPGGGDDYDYFARLNGGDDHLSGPSGNGHPAANGHLAATDWNGHAPSTTGNGHLPGTNGNGHLPGTNGNGHLPSGSNGYSPGGANGHLPGTNGNGHLPGTNGNGHVAGANGRRAAGVASASGRARRHPQGGRHERRDWARDLTAAGRVAVVEDVRLLLLPRHLRLRSLFPRLIFVALGYAAITSLAAAYAEAVPLPVTACLVVLPAVTVVVATSMRNPQWGRRALVGWLAGIVATIIYDMLRLSLVQVGIWGDPIPTIGRLALADPHASFVWGYVWRFLGNGGGMGMAFAMLPWRGVRSGIVYGTMICSGLFALLFFVPVAQTHFFPLTPITAAGAMAGHWVYGAVLGWLTRWWLPPVRLERVHGRLVAKVRHPGPVSTPRDRRRAAGTNGFPGMARPEQPRPNHGGRATDQLRSAP